MGIFVISRKKKEGASAYQQKKEKPEGWTRREKSEATRFGNRVVLLS